VGKAVATTAAAAGALIGGAQVRHLVDQAMADGTLTLQEAKRIAFEAIESPMVNVAELFKVLGTSNPEESEYVEVVEKGEDPGLVEQAFDGIANLLSGLFA
jgi:hypothetical protein